MSNSTNILTLKVPYSLAAMATGERHLVNKYQTNHFIKNITAWLILKAESPLGLIRDYKNQIDHLAYITQCEQQTFKKRLAWMIKEQIATIEGSDIRLKSWKQAAALLYFSLNEFKLIQYNPDEHKNIYLRLFTTEIEENKNRQAYMIEQKMKKNPALKQVVQSTMLQFGADPNKINDFKYLLNGMRKLYRESFVAEPEIHNILKNVRPDLNRSVKGLAKAWNYRSKQSASYIKSLLTKAGMIVIHKQDRVTSKERSRNNECHIIWDKRKMQTVLCLVDTIEVVQKNLAA